MPFYYRLSEERSSRLTGKNKSAVDQLSEDFFQVAFQRDDGQRMKVEADGRVVSLGSNHPTTGFAFEYDVLDSEGSKHPA